VNSVFFALSATVPDALLALDVINGSHCSCLIHWVAVLCWAWSRRGGNGKELFCDWL